MPSRLDTVVVWNRRVHYYAGLYLLFFCWLFAFSGLLLNHPTWRFAEFWPVRVQQTAVREFETLAGASDLDRARHLMQQLDLAGEVHWPARPPAGGTLTFQVSRPGRMVDVNADLGAGRATLRQVDVNAWGVLQALHAFTGMRAGDPINHRDWILTTVWALAMDAVAIGLIVMVLGSYIMWGRLASKRRGGLAALALGYLACAAFLGSWFF